VVVGEALGDEEVKAGRPFAGSSGQFLDRIIQRTIDPDTAQALQAEDFLITNCIRCRPPDNKLTKTPWEFSALDQCRPYLDSFLKLHKPKCIIALGNTALRWFRKRRQDSAAASDNLVAFPVPALPEAKAA
jgi:uracil-DNA glycosylase family 4